MKALATKSFTLTAEQERELEPIRECSRQHPTTMVMADWWPVGGNRMKVGVVSEFDSVLLGVISNPACILRAFRMGDIPAETVLAVRAYLRELAA